MVFFRLKKHKAILNTMLKEIFPLNIYSSYIDRTNKLVNKKYKLLIRIKVSI